MGLLLKIRALAEGVRALLVDASDAPDFAAPQGPSAHGHLARRACLFVFHGKSLVIFSTCAPAPRDGAQG
jgi:hypothetical protein